MTIGHPTNEQDSGGARGICGKSGQMNFTVVDIPFDAQNSAPQRWTETSASNILPTRATRRGSRQRVTVSTLSSPLPTVPPRSASGAMAAAAHGATLPAAHFDWIVPPKKIQLEDVGWHLDSIVNQGVCSAILRHTDLEPKLDKLEGAPKKKKQKRTKQAYTFAPMLQTVSTPGSPPICPPPPLHLSPHHSRFIHN